MHWTITSEFFVLCRVRLTMWRNDREFYCLKFRFIVAPVFLLLNFDRRLNDAQTKLRKSLGDVDGSSDGGTSPQMPRSQSGISVRSRRSMPSQKSASRNSVDEPLCISAELHDLPEGSESGDSETATEVEVSALCFRRGRIRSGILVFHFI